jgi:hypothetical protein
MSDTKSMKKLIYPAAGAALGYYLAPNLPAPLSNPMYAAIAGALLGYLMNGGKTSD